MNKRSGHLYIIDGDISSLCRHDLNKKRIWDFITIFKANNHISLQKQHGDFDKLDGPLYLESKFYLPFPGSYYKGKEYTNRYHLAKPYLSGLLLLIEHIGENIIFRNPASIAAVQATKYYDTERPRVEFKLFEIKAKDKDQDV